jgi:FMN phosphatase YigB (HAD superfamily)
MININEILAEVIYKDIDLPEPKPIITIKDRTIATLQNFICITGLPKSYKTTFAMHFIASGLANKTIFDISVKVAKNDKIILVDADGVLLDWEWAFAVWMEEHGFTKVQGWEYIYNIGKRYGIDPEQGHKLIKIFNESAAIGFLPALRDSMYYVKRLHEEHSYEFHCITSLSTDRNAQRLREMNLQKLFGKTAFSKFIFLDTGADKDEVLEQYRNTNLYWIEDKPENALAGLDVGLKPLLMEHGHNMDYDNNQIPKVKNWKEIYNIITGEK